MQKKIVFVPLNTNISHRGPCLSVCWHSLDCKQSGFGIDRRLFAQQGKPCVCVWCTQSDLKAEDQTFNLQNGMFFSLKFLLQLLSFEIFSLIKYFDLQLIHVQSSNPPTMQKNAFVPTNALGSQRCPCFECP